MGLFDAFKKKQCDLCGGEIALMGNKKLNDGNMCKTCEKKLSPWFDGRRKATIEQIREQLAYRQKNREKVDTFTATRIFGEKNKLLLDEKAWEFAVGGGDNPDILSFADLMDCFVDIHSRNVEKKYRNKDGEYVSYSPPRNTWYYDFYLVLRVNNPYFNTMRLRMNQETVRVEDNGYVFNPQGDSGYARCKQMAEEAKAYMLRMRQEFRNRAEAAKAPRKAVVCSHCCATTTPDASGCCEFCGSAIE